MNFQELIYPLALNEFAQKVARGENFLMSAEGKRDFTQLLSIEELELSINAGCNINTPLQVIYDGKRNTLVDSNVSWSPVALKKKEIGLLLEQGHSFIMRNMSQINKKVSALIDEVENTFQGAHADLHIYASPNKNSTGYDAHRDRPQHKIYIQVFGRTNWKIFQHEQSLPDEIAAITSNNENQHLTLEKEFTMNPGDVFYMPPGVFHKVRNFNEPRISFSIPFVINNNTPTPRMDRTHIAFSQMFKSAMKNSEARVNQRK